MCAATVQLQAFCASATEPAGANAETGITFNREDTQNGATPVPIPTATGSNYSWIKNLALAVTASASTTISARQIALASAPATGLLLHWRASLAPATPAAPTLTPSTTGGTLPAGNWQYRIAALNANGTTLAGPEAASAATTTGTTGSVAVNWAAITGASGGYAIYGRTAGAELLMATVAAGTTTWTDNGSITPSGAMPGSNTATAYGQATSANMPAASGSNGAVPAGFTQASLTAATYDAAAVSASSTGRNGGFAVVVTGVDAAYAGGAGSAIALPAISLSYTEA